MVTIESVALQKKRVSENLINLMASPRKRPLSLELSFGKHCLERAGKTF